MRLFGFEYVWEVYKPAPRRRWGYYVLPILLEDSLKGRVDLQRDAESKSLVVTGFWLENQKDEQNTRFARAFGRSLIRLSRMNSLDRVTFNVPVPRNFQQNVLKMTA